LGQAGRRGEVATVNLGFAASASAPNGDWTS
jgi:hypothetical protein